MPLEEDPQEPFLDGVICIHCHTNLSWEEALGVIVFPAKVSEASQQWWVHPKCMLEFIHEGLRDSFAIRPEIAAMMDVPIDEWMFLEDLRGDADE